MVHTTRPGKPVMAKRRFVVLPALVAAALVLAACGSSGQPARTSGATTSQPARSQPAPTQPAAPSSRPKPAAPRPTGPVITVRSSQYGPIIADGSNRTIYLFTSDRSTSSTCYGACAAAWPPVLTRGAPKPAGGLGGSLGSAHRRGGALQVTYGGHPLYYYVGDTKPGEILCQNVDEFGGTWLVISRLGTPVR
jgi:predicted lipoprotein with Yx(FWY)xxD motif